MALFSDWSVLQRLFCGGRSINFPPQMRASQEDLLPSHLWREMSPNVYSDLFLLSRLVPPRISSVKSPQIRPQGRSKMKILSARQKMMTRASAAVVYSTAVKSWPAFFEGKIERRPFFRKGQLFIPPRIINEEGKLGLFRPCVIWQKTDWTLEQTPIRVARCFIVKMAKLWEVQRGLFHWGQGGLFRWKKVCRKL